MKWIEGWDRQQMHLLPERIEDYVSGENPVRFLDVFVDGLDLRAAGFALPKEDPRGRGRAPYKPGDLLKLYLYGYLHQIRSSRKLEAECGRNLELIWLLRKLAPDFKTIADFRKNNAAAFKAVAREFTQLCRQLDLFGGQLLVIDGTKIKGQNAPERNGSQTKLAKQLALSEAKVSAYLQALEAADLQGPKAPPLHSPETLQAKLDYWRQRQAQVQARLAQMEATGQSQYSLTDADSRGMKGRQGHVVGYNVQAAADAKHHLLAVLEATNAPTDQGLLTTVAQQAQATLELQQAAVVADGGYYTNQDIKGCQDLGLEVHLPKVTQSSSERAGLYGKEHFTYDTQNDTYGCPAGATLARRRQVEDRGKVLYSYTNESACRHCPIKSRCTASHFRTLSRWEHEAAVERMARQVAAAPEKLRRRKTIIEHCMGTLKWLLPGGFLLRGLVKVQSELSLVQVAYNLKRALAVVGLVGLMEKLKELRKSRALIGLFLKIPIAGGDRTLRGWMSVRLVH